MLQKAKLDFAVHTVLGIASNLEMIQSMLSICISYMQILYHFI